MPTVIIAGRLNEEAHRVDHTGHTGERQECERDGFPSFPTREVCSDESSHHAAPTAGLADRWCGDGVTRAGEEGLGWKETRAGEPRRCLVRSG